MKKKPKPTFCLSEESGIKQIHHPFRVMDFCYYNLIKSAALRYEGGARILMAQAEPPGVATFSAPGSYNYKYEIVIL